MSDPRSSPNRMISENESRSALLPWRRAAIGAAGGGLLAFGLVVFSGPEFFWSRLENDFGRAILLPVLIGIVFGSAFALALWATLVKRRIPLLFLIPSWGLVCGVAAIVVAYIPLSVWCYVQDVRLTAVDHTPRGVGKAMAIGLLASMFTFPIGFIVGAIVAPFKQSQE